MNGATWDRWAARVLVFQAVKLAEVVWVFGAVAVAVVEYDRAGLGWAVLGYLGWPIFMGAWLGRGWLLPLLRAQGLLG